MKLKIGAILVLLSASQVQAYDYAFTLSPPDAQYLWEVLRNTPLPHYKIDPILKSLQKSVDKIDKEEAEKHTDLLIKQREEQKQKDKEP